MVQKSFIENCYETLILALLSIFSPSEGKVEMDTSRYITREKGLGD